MKRRLIALLAVPAFAVGFAVASPAAEAQAIDPGAGMAIACGMAKQMIADSYSYGDYETAQYIENWAADAGCSM